jgi:hypothetical protein
MFKPGIPNLLVVLVVVNIAIYNYYPSKRFDTIVIHHSATDTGNYETIKKAHLTRGWTDAAYHLILSNGSTEIPAGYLEPTNRYLDMEPSVATKDRESNLRGIHLCIVGNYEKNEFPDELKAPLAHAVRLLQEKYDIGDDYILFHGRDCNATKCPGRHLRKKDLLHWIKTIADDCPVDIMIQQEKVISEAILRRPERRARNMEMIAVSAVLTAIWITFIFLSGKLSKKKKRKHRKTI